MKTPARSCLHTPVIQFPRLCVPAAMSRLRAPAGSPCCPRGSSWRPRRSCGQFPGWPRSRLEQPSGVARPFTWRHRTCAGGRNPGTPDLREWRRFLAPAIDGPGGGALLELGYRVGGIQGWRAGGWQSCRPFPWVSPAVSAQWDEQPLRLLLSAEYTVGVVLLRLGRYLGGCVQRHGNRWSPDGHPLREGQAPRRRHIPTEVQAHPRGQMRKLFDEACGVVSDRFRPHERDMDYILLGGEKLTLSGFLKVCPYLQRRQDIILDPGSTSGTPSTTPWRRWRACCGRVGYGQLPH